MYLTLTDVCHEDIVSKGMRTSLIFTPRSLERRVDRSGQRGTTVKFQKQHLFALTGVQTSPRTFRTTPVMTTQEAPLEANSLESFH